MSLPYLKGNCTRYQNLIEKEISKSGALVSQDAMEEDISELLRQVESSTRRLKDFSGKLEENIEKWSLSVESKEVDQGEVDKFTGDSERLFALLAEAAEHIDQLMMLERSLQERITTVKATRQTTDSRLDHIVFLQEKMQEQILQFQELQLHQSQFHTAPQGPLAVRLPKLELPSYNGDKIKFKDFWDAFDATINRNSKLSRIEKFNYLQSKLTGEAKAAISGISLSHENYDVAIDIIQERFGDAQSVINKHYMELINIQPVTNDTLSLRRLYDDLEKHMRSLEALRQDVNQDVFVSMITSKLPKETLLQLEIQKGSRDKWTVKKLRDLFKAYVTAKESTEFQASDAHNHVENHATAEALMISTKESKERRNASSAKSPVCSFCNGYHWTDECRKYRTIEDRKQRIKGKCYICLRPGHRIKDCRVVKPCFHCRESRNHHRSLCPKKFPHQRDESTRLEKSTQKETSCLADESHKEKHSTAESLQESSMFTSGDIVLMQTAHTEVSNPVTNKKEAVRILMDSGSQRTYITEDLAKRLNFRMGQTEEISLITFGADKLKRVKTPQVILKMKLKEEEFMTINANVVPKITGTILRRPIPQIAREKLFSLCRHLQMSDTIPTAFEDSRVDILIGNDYYLDIISSEKIGVQEGLYLLGSKLGWIITGRTHSSNDERKEHQMMIANGLLSITECCLRSSERCLPVKPLLEDFWNLETIGIKDSPYTSDDEVALRNFNSTLEMGNNRYHVTWPWKSSCPELPENRELAYGRFKSLVHKMQSKPDFLQKYDEIIQDQCTKGIIEKIPHSSEETGIKHYIPHHAVIDPTKPTTKVRIVYDASAKSKQSNLSLNECLHRGPVMLQDLCGLLLRFRMNRIGIVADIEKAFLQVGLQVKDRDATRFFWLKDVNTRSIENNTQVYRFCRVPFGVISSPFLLAATIDHHLSMYNSETAENIRNNIYVDNVITGVDTVTDAEVLYKDSKEIFSAMSMNLRDWASNNKEFYNSIPKSDQSVREKMKILGLTWILTDDTLAVPCLKCETEVMPVTKREVLQRVASIYDPLGFFTPVTLKTKLFLQMLWRKNLDWDEQLTEEDVQQWQLISTDLQDIPQCHMPRYIGLPG
ncbi:uncharacterized protein LOC125656535 [Ostrea edulis]|uniref:uncharacterized protein LOC125656535 n=1 Tax=Ostrea edulis TaxID=37623 RepID=UPI0024AFABE8|nr:uncharacterized protein LOC125656535 [Ostrea edulis]